MDIIKKHNYVEIAFNHRLPYSQRSTPPLTNCQTILCCDLVPLIISSLIVAAYEHSTAVMPFHTDGFMFFFELSKF